MKGSLLRAIEEIPTDRTSTPSPATQIIAVPARGGVEMVAATPNVIASLGKSRNWTGCQAGLIDTGIAGFRPAILGRQTCERFGKGKSATIGVPKAMVRVNQHTQRGFGDRLGPFGPGDERPIGRTAKRIERHAPQATRELVYDPPAPAVQGIGMSVQRLRPGRKCAPHFRADVAQENHASSGLPGKIRHLVFRRRRKATPESQPDTPRFSFDFTQIHIQAIRQKRASFKMPCRSGG